jgi:serine/threonine protein kinase
MSETYNVIKTIGSGAFGKTYAVQDFKTNEMYVLKVLKMKKDNIYEIYNEINVLKKIKKYGCHTNILCYVKHFVNIERSEMNIITEMFKESQTLGSFIRELQQDRTYLSTRELLHIMYSLLHGLSYLHKIGIAHSDIKPENILINQKLNTQIIDFGLSCTKKCKPGGTILFLSPEMINNFNLRSDLKLYQVKVADVYSLGIVFYLLANLELPFHLPNSPYDVDLNTSVEEQSINQLGMMWNLKSVYKNNKMLFPSHFGTNNSIDNSINDFIEEMLVISTERVKKSRPHSQRLLTKLKRIITEYNKITDSDKVPLSP